MKSEGNAFRFPIPGLHGLALKPDRHTEGLTCSPPRMSRPRGVQGQARDLRNPLRVEEKAGRSSALLRSPERWAEPMAYGSGVRLLAEASARGLAGSSPEGRDSPDAPFGWTEGRRGGECRLAGRGRVASLCCSRRRRPRPCPVGGRQAAPLALGRERPGRSSRRRLFPESLPTKKGSEAAPELCPSAPRFGRLEPAASRRGRRPRRRPLRQLPRKEEKQKQPPPPPKTPVPGGEPSTREPGNWLNCIPPVRRDAGLRGDGGLSKGPSPVPASP